MEMLYELKTKSGFCRVFDFFADAKFAMDALIRQGVFAEDELYINTVVTE